MVDKLPNYAIHPGVILRQYLKDEKITKASFSKKTGVNSATLNKILRGKGSISAERRQNNCFPKIKIIQIWETIIPAFE